MVTEYSVARDDRGNGPVRSKHPEDYVGLLGARVLFLNTRRCIAWRFRRGFVGREGVGRGLVLGWDGLGLGCVFGG